MSKHSASVLESQLDWLTCAVHTQDGADRLERFASAWANISERDAGRPAPFRLKGYEGWRRGRVRFGERQGAALVQLSGQLAADHFDTLLPMADSISRIDIAVTARLDPPDPDVGQRSYGEAVAFYQSRARAAIPSAHQDADGGYTCYVGDRSSDWFLRIYNKAAESAGDPDQAEHYAGCWRYELECKGGTAGVLAAHLGATGSVTRSSDVQSMIHDYVTKHGMTPTFNRDDGAELVSGFRRRSDRDSKLAWLAKSVKPAVDYITQTGDAADVYAALGLLFSGDPATAPISGDPEGGPIAAQTRLPQPR